MEKKKKTYGSKKKKFRERNYIKLQSTNLRIELPNKIKQEIKILMLLHLNKTVMIVI